MSDTLQIAALTVIFIMIMGFTYVLSNNNQQSEAESIIPVEYADEAQENELQESPTVAEIDTAPPIENINPNRDNEIKDPSQGGVPEVVLPPTQGGIVGCEQIDALIEQNKVTVRGNDANNNGIRDDIDCIINDQLGDDADNLIWARRHATALQAMLVGDILYTPTELADSQHFQMMEPRVQQYLDVSTCAPGTLLTRLGEMTRAITNTPEREGLYRSLMSGVFTGLIGASSPYCNPVWFSK